MAKPAEERWRDWHICVGATGGYAFAESAGFTLALTSGCTLRRFAEELDGYLAWYVGGRLKAFGTPGGTVYDTIAHRREVLGYNS